jgi:hypothetical protein
MSTESVLLALEPMALVLAAQPMVTSASTGTRICGTNTRGTTHSTSTGARICGTSARDATCSAGARTGICGTSARGATCGAGAGTRMYGTSTRGATYGASTDGKKKLIKFIVNHCKFIRN